MSEESIQPAQPGEWKTFAIGVGIAYLLPALVFAALVFALPGAPGVVRYLITIVASAFWGLLALWSIRRTGITLEDIGLTRSKLRTAVGLVLLGWALFALILFPVALSGGESIADQFGSFPSIFQQWLFVGIGEELLFRGFFLTWLRRRFAARGRIAGAALALLVTNLIFATMHIPQRLYTIWKGELLVSELLLELLMLFVWGLLFSYIYLRSGNILLAGLVHGSGNAHLIGNNGDLLPLLIFILVLEGYLFWQRRKRKLVLQAA